MLRLTYLALDRPEAELVVSRHATPEDLAAVERFRNPARRCQSLTARALLRAVLGESAPGDWRLVQEPGGAPRLASGAGARPPFVSLSHSRGMVACALSTAGRIGVDIELQRDDRPVQDIAAAVFGSEEGVQVARLGSAAFYRLWTLREALAKATGIGFPLVVRRLDLVAAGPDPTRTRFEETDWTLAHWILPGGYSLGVATEAGTVPAPEPYVPA